MEAIDLMEMSGNDTGTVAIFREGIRIANKADKGPPMKTTGLEVHTGADGLNIPCETPESLAFAIEQECDEGFMEALNQMEMCGNDVETQAEREPHRKKARLVVQTGAAGPNLPSEELENTSHAIEQDSTNGLP